MTTASAVLPDPVYAILHKYDWYPLYSWWGVLEIGSIVAFAILSIIYVQRGSDPKDNRSIDRFGYAGVIPNFFTAPWFLVAILTLGAGLLILRLMRS